MRTPRVLLTGASGFLGAHALRELLAATDWTFVCPVTFRHKGIPQRIDWALQSGETPEYLDRVQVVRHDLATPVTAMTREEFGAIDLILNFASDTHPPRSVTHPVEFVHNNVDIALYLLEYARSLERTPLFVQISTNSVYGPAVGDSSHPEWDAIIPNNPYGASKVAQEALAISYWRSYNLPVILINTMNPIGETQDTEKYIPSTIKKILRGERIDIHANAAGEVGFRTYVDAPEVVAGIRAAVEKGSVGRSGHTDRPARWHIGGRQEIDNLEVAAIVANQLSMPYDVQLVAVDRPEHGHRYSLSSEKARWTLDWRASPSIEPAIRRITDWTAQHPEWNAL